jgi:hypothetical protein
MCVLNQTQLSNTPGVEEARLPKMRVDSNFALRQALFEAGWFLNEGSSKLSAAFVFFALFSSVVAIRPPGDIQNWQWLDDF